MISVVGCFLLSEIRISFNALSTSFTSFICLDFFHFFAQFYCPSGCITLTVDGYKRRISRFASCLLTATCIFTRRDNGCPVHLRQFCLKRPKPTSRKKVGSVLTALSSQTFWGDFSILLLLQDDRSPTKPFIFFPQRKKETEDNKKNLKLIVITYKTNE